MSLFSSSSKSQTTQYTESHQTSNTLGDLSHDNILSGGDLSIYKEGLTDENLALVLDTAQQSVDKSISSAQLLAGQAIETVGKSYADAYSGANNDSARFIDALKPFAFIAGIVAIFYLWGKK